MTGFFWLVKDSSGYARIEQVTSGYVRLVQVSFITSCKVVCY
jgi:hypothetical protein